MASYKIKKGDTLSAIAKANGTTVDAIAKANGIKNKNLIITGKTLNIPGKSNSTRSTPSVRQTGGTGASTKKSSGPSAVTGKKVQTSPSKPKGSSIGGSGKVTVTTRDGKKITADYGTKSINTTLPKAAPGSITTRTGAVAASNAKTSAYYSSMPKSAPRKPYVPTRKPTAAEIALAKKRAGGSR